MKKVLWGIVFVWGVGTVGAATVEEVTARLEATEKTVKTLSFDFKQTVESPSLNEPVSSAGTAVFQRPDLFRLTWDSSEPRTIISDGKTLWLHLPKRRQVLRDTVSRWFGASGFPRELTPFQLSVSDMKARYVWVLEEINGIPVLKLTPKDPSADYSLRLWIDMKTGLAQKTEWVNPSGSTTIDLSNVRMNPVLPKKAFDFSVPVGTDVLDTARS